MDRLSGRKRTILGAVIIEYVSSVEPVASETILQNFSLGVSSATVRNEFAELSELGYLQKPHTSAGRIPSDQGYRFFVDHMMNVEKPGVEEMRHVRRVTEHGDVLQNVLRESVRFLSRSTQLLSGATIAGRTQVKVRHGVVSALGPDRALLVLVLDNGHVENRLIELPIGVTLEQVGAANELVLSEVVGLTLKSLQTLRVANPDRLIQALVGTLKTVAKELSKGVVVTAGEELLLNQPELKRNELIFPQLIAALEEDDVLMRSLSHTPTEVTIGAENEDERLRAFSVIRSSFSIGEEPVGSVAVIGPTRLNYSRNLGYVEFIAKAVSDMLTRMSS